MIVAQSIAHVWLFLLLAAGAHSVETCTVGASCIADAEASITNPEVSAILSLLQAGHSLQTVNSAPEVGLTKYMAKMQHQILALFSVLMPSQVSPLAAASKRDNNKISNTTEVVPLPGTSLGDKAMQVRSLWYMIVALLVLAFGFAHWLGMRPRLFRFWRGAGGAKREPCKLMAMFEELDELDLSDDFPPGYLSRADWQQALSDQQAEMVWPKCKCKQCRRWSRYWHG